MSYRHWALSQKLVYWLAVAGLVAVVCVLLSKDELGPSSATAPVAEADGSAHPGLGADAAPAEIAAAQDGSGSGATTPTTVVPAVQAVAPGGGSGPAVAIAKVTAVARLSGDTPGSPSPGAAPTQTVPGSWYGYPSILPVIAKVPGWLEVRLAQRPNGSTAWIPASDATVSKIHYAIVVDLATMHLTVYRHGREIDDFPAGIGKPSSPTPPGDFFVAMTVPPPSAGYGPLVLVTSGHSNAITDWDDSGDAIIAIHGPIDAAADASIGTTGAAVSDGCVRLHDGDLEQLGLVPPGTPVDIVSS